MTIPVKYQHDKGSVLQFKALLALLFILLVSSVLLSFLALRNARTLACDEISTDPWNNTVCVIRIRQ